MGCIEYPAHKGTVMSAWIHTSDRLKLSALQRRTGQLGTTPRRWALRGPMQVIARRPGWLLAGTAPLWVTLPGQPQDWVLQPGERLTLQRGQLAVAGPWHADGPVVVLWQPATQARWAGLRQGVATGLAALAAALAAGARGVESLAGRARQSLDEGAIGQVPCAAP